MNIIDSYILCTKTNDLELNQTVRGLLQEGYQPFGEPFSTQDVELPFYCQAMVKYRETASLFDR